MSVRVIRPDAKLVQEVEYTRQKQQLPTNKPVVQYIRQSTIGQVLSNKVSGLIQQDIKLRKRLVSMGWLDDDKWIIKIDKDQGKSGQKSQDERAGLKEIYGMMKRGEIGAIACYDCSRLHRDLTRVYYTDFVHKCEEYGIVVIMFDTEYFPNSRQDMDNLIEKFKDAARQLDQIYLKANPARLLAIEENISYGGHAVPFGFVVVGEKGERKYYKIYEPHARLVRWLFRRYRELGGSLSRLAQELRSTGFKFPAFTGIAKIPHVALRFDGEGYPLRTRDALVSILTNVAYIGWYMFDGVVVSKEAHEPIITDMHDFMFAYNRLSNQTLDGEINENKPKVDRRYGREVNALLEGVLESDGKPVYAIARRQSYEAVTSRDNWQSTELVVRIADVDGAFSTALITLLSTLELRHRQGLQDSLYERLNALQKEKHEEVVSYEETLANIDKAIGGWELDKQSAREQEYKPGIDEANKQLKRLHADREAIQAKQQQASGETDELAECQTLIECAIEKWDSLPFERQKRFVHLAVEKANMREVSPHIIRLDVTLGEPINCILTGHIYRVWGGREDWTEEEQTVLRQIYQRADRLEVLQALPTRSWDSIRLQAISMHLSRSTRTNTGSIPDNLTYADWTTMQEVGMCKDSPHWNASECSALYNNLPGSS